MNHFNGYFVNTQLDIKSINQDILNISNKIKSNPLPWNGQFSPQLVQILLNNYSRLTDVIFDPFLGSGTSLLEAGIIGLRCFGTEINYAAICLSRIYQLINTNIYERIALINDIENILISHGLIFSDSLFSRKTDNPITEIKEILKNNTDINKTIIFEAFVILIDMYKDNFTNKWLEQKWIKIKELIHSLPVSKNEIEVLYEDARETTIKTSSIDMVITSPPYINVFNYHQQYRTSAEFLNGSVLHAAQAEIGSNRKHRSNRYYTVIQYCLDMCYVFNELNRVCKDGARIIFVVGRESSVRKTSFFNGEIVSEIACRCNKLKILNRQERVFTNRFGLSIYEDILHFSSTKNILGEKEMFYLSREVALETLKSVMTHAPEESKNDLVDAIENYNIIEPSPKTLFSNKLRGQYDKLTIASW